jgi:hypothetical protein
VKAVNFRDDRGPRVLPLRNVGRQTVGRRFGMGQPHGDVEPVETRRARDAGIDQDRTQTETTVGEGSQFGSVSTVLPTLAGLRRIGASIAVSFFARAAKIHWARVRDCVRQNGVNREIAISTAHQVVVSAAMAGSSLEAVRKLNVLQINVLASEEAARQDGDDGDPDVGDKEIGVAVEHSIEPAIA